MLKKSKPDGNPKTNWLAIIKVLNSKQRLQTLLFLFIYQELSLTELSQQLNRTKNTVVYHMKMLINSGLIIEFDKPIEGSIKPAKHYRINPEFYQKMFVPFENPENLTKDEILEYSHQIFRWNALLFETIREFLKELRHFYSKKENNIKNAESALHFHNNTQTPRDLIPLSEKGYQEYQKKYLELIEHTQKILTQENEKEEVIRPYLAFNTVLPIKELLEFRKRQDRDDMI